MTRLFTGRFAFWLVFISGNQTCSGEQGIRLSPLDKLQPGASKGSALLFVFQALAIENIFNHWREVVMARKPQLRIRKDINDVRGDIIRHDENFAQIELRLDRIEKRLGLIDA